MVNAERSGLWPVLCGRSPATTRAQTGSDDGEGKQDDDAPHVLGVTTGRIQRRCHSMRTAGGWLASRSRVTDDEGERRQQDNSDDRRPRLQR